MHYSNELFILIAWVNHTPTHLPSPLQEEVPKPHQEECTLLELAENILSNDGEDVNEGWDDRRAEVMGRRAMVGTCARRVGTTMVGTNAKENERKQDSSRGNDW